MVMIVGGPSLTLLFGVCPYEGLSLLEMLGDELALKITPFPRKPGAAAPEFEVPEEEVEEERPNPFAVLQSLKS